MISCYNILYCIILFKNNIYCKQYLPAVGTIMHYSNICGEDDQEKGKLKQLHMEF